MPTMAVSVKYIWSCPKRSLDSALGRRFRVRGITGIPDSVSHARADTRQHQTVRWKMASHAMIHGVEGETHARDTSTPRGPLTPAPQRLCRHANVDTR